MKINSIIMLSMVSSIAQGGSVWSGGSQILEVAATITCTDGTILNVDNLRINGSTEMMAYTKPANIKATDASEIMLEINPHDSSVGPFQLSSIKTLALKSPSTTYTYQQSKTIKQSYLEIEIDGMSYLIPKNWKLHGTDTTNHKKRSVDFHIVEKIVITSVHTKTDTAGECICPTVK